MSHKRHIISLLAACAIVPSMLAMESSKDNEIITQDELREIPNIIRLLKGNASDAMYEHGIVVVTNPPTEIKFAATLRDQILEELDEQQKLSELGCDDQYDKPPMSKEDSAAWEQAVIEELNLKSLKKHPKTVIFSALAKDARHLPLVLVNDILRQQKGWLVIQQLQNWQEHPGLFRGEDDKPFVTMFLSKDDSKTNTLDHLIAVRQRVHIKELSSKKQYPSFDDESE